MEKMKLYKQIDIILQIVGTIFALFIGFAEDEGGAILAYFVLGGLQVTSFLLHFLTKGNWVLTSAREKYGITLLAIIGCVLITLPFEEALIIPLGLLLLTAPFMALYYGNICYREIKNLTTATN